MTRKLAAVADQLESRGVEVCGQLHAGNQVGLVRHARDLGADVVATTAGPQDFFNRLFHRGGIEDVLYQAPIPILVSPP